MRKLRKKEKGINGMSKGYKPLFFGALGFFFLIGLYFILMTVLNSFSLAILQFYDMWYWFVLLALGFGFQMGLFSYVRQELRSRQNTAAMATCGGISTTTMVACCLHHVGDVVPVLGFSAAILFFAKYQVFFIIIGILSNLLGATMMLRIVQKENLVKNKTGFWSILRADMDKAFLFSVVLISVAILSFIFSFVI